MIYYIDPGTGSMLFAILIGIIGALRYMMKIGIMKLRFLMSGGKKVEMDTASQPFVIFSDNKRYWNIFEPICREFDRRGIDVLYLTASADDPALKCELEHVKGKFLGEGNKAFAYLNFMEADIVLSTTPGLDVYQWKRSKGVKHYCHVPHAAGEIILYRMFGIDYYDSMLLSGEFQVEDVRRLEELRSLPQKELFRVGLPYMDEMKKRLEAAGKVGEHQRTVLLAPSWGPSSILNRIGGSIIDELLKTGYHIIIRPHPQSFDSEKELMEQLMNKYPASQQLEWNRDVDNFEVLRRSDILISDFSGIFFDFAMIYDKPIMYMDTQFDKAPYDAWWLDGELWIMKALPRIGMKLTRENLPDLKNMIDTCIEDPTFAEGRNAIRRESWDYIGEGAVRTVDWLVNKQKELTSEEKQ